MIDLALAANLQTTPPFSRYSGRGGTAAEGGAITIP
jgi:hypothetical protein